MSKKSNRIGLAAFRKNRKKDVDEVFFQTGTGKVGPERGIEVKRDTSAKPIAMPPGWKSVPASKGTAAFEYIHGLRPLASVASDPRVLGGQEQPDGTLVLFKDGSSFVQQITKKLQ